mmetsp:Transcript_18845/g.28637  ORF Transcript_18845/g.28637 Transcript_18845/m.28637 type:complete len:368 (-) Transcript_18845:1449-2552(-)
MNSDHDGNESCGSSECSYVDLYAVIEGRARPKGRQSNESQISVAQTMDSSSLEKMDPEQQQRPEEDDNSNLAAAPVFSLSNSRSNRRILPVEPDNTRRRGVSPPPPVNYQRLQHASRNRRSSFPPQNRNEGWVMMENSITSLSTAIVPVAQNNNESQFGLLQRPKSPQRFPRRVQPVDDIPSSQTAALNNDDDDNLSIYSRTSTVYSRATCPGSFQSSRPSSMSNIQRRHFSRRRMHQNNTSDSTMSLEQQQRRRRNDDDLNNNRRLEGLSISPSEQNSGNNNESTNGFDSSVASGINLLRNDFATIDPDRLEQIISSSASPQQQQHSHQQNSNKEQNNKKEEDRMRRQSKKEKKEKKKKKKSRESK